MCYVEKNAAKLFPIVISSTGVIPKPLSQSLKRLNMHPDTYTYVYIQMQKSVVLAHVQLSESV